MREIMCIPLKRNLMHFSFLAMHIEISSDMLCTPKSCMFAQSHAYLTVGQANLTVEKGCPHCKQCQEVERSVYYIW